VPDYLVWSILETVLCCLPGRAFGIAGIVYSSRANSKKAAGDFRGALEDAAMAKKLLIIGISIAAALVAIYIVIVVLGFAFGSSGDSGTTDDYNF
jgi:hypothetical protein